MDKWDKRFMQMTEQIGTWSSCFQENRKVGAIIVKDKRIIATGYNGAPRGRVNCTTVGRCMRDELGIPRGERYEMCRSVHAEANAIINASREQMIGATIYMTGIDSKTGQLLPDVCSCMMCKRLIINAGIETVVIRNPPEDYTVIRVQDWVDNDDSLSGKFGY